MPKLYCIGPSTRDLRARLGGTEPGSRDVDEEPEETDTEANAEAMAPADDEPDPEAPYRAWDLGAPSKADSEAERIALIEQIIDAFESIALRPRDPANGYGPFAEAAPWMDEPQVRRSLAVTDRMKGTDWGDGLSSARRSLRGASRGLARRYLRGARGTSISEALKAFARILTFSARAPRSGIVQQLRHTYDFEGILRWLGGEEAIVATRQALDDAVWVLG